MSSTRQGRGLIPLLILAVLFLGGWAFFDTFSNVGYAPQQPIPFSHKLHAGQSKIPCEYCHSSASRSRYATVPSSNVCMNCHLVARTDRAGVQELTKLYEADQPIPWVRVHRLPDYVYFSHRWHVAKGVQCQECHGPVEEMDLVRQVASLKMGWCIDCHRKNEASQECQTCHM